MFKRNWLRFIVLAMFFTITNKAAESGWAVKYYADSAFFLPGGVTTAPGGTVNLNPNHWKYPANNRDAAKGAVYVRKGWSAVFRGVVTIPETGPYSFRLDRGTNDTAAYRVSVNGWFTDDPKGDSLHLKKGHATIEVFVRQAAARIAKPNINFTLRWRLPAAQDFTVISEIIRPAGKNAGADVVTFDKALTFADGYQIDPSYRRFTVEIPESGMYSIVMHLRSTPSFLRLWLDDTQIRYIQGRYIRGNDDFYGDIDRAGDRTRQRYDFFGCVRLNRYLEKGRHNLDFYAYYGPWMWGDMIEKVLAESIHLGISRLPGVNPYREAGFYLENRDNMVFNLNEKFSLRAQSATAAPAKYRCEIRPARSQQVVWSKEIMVNDQPQYFTYDCPQEGAFEYVIRNADGDVVDGPWAFAVADSTPIPLPRQQSGAALPVKETVVDRVDCVGEGAGGPHHFRDNGTSYIVKSPNGSYRATGLTGMTRISYVIQKGKIIREKTPKDKSNGRSDSFLAMDWYAYTLTARNPGRAHIVRIKVPNDVRRLVAAQAIDRMTGYANGWLLDAGEAPAAGPFSDLAFFVWPNTPEIDVMLFNTNGNHGSTRNRQSAAQSIELIELPETLPALPVAAHGWRNTAEFGWDGEQIDLGVNERTMPPLLPEGKMIPTVGAQRLTHGWDALLTSWERFGQTAAYRGDNLCIFPVYTYSMISIQGPGTRLIPPGNDVYTNKRDNAEVVDQVDRDVFALMLAKASKYHLKLVADLMVQRIQSREAAIWAKTYGCTPEGALLTADASGKPWHSFSNAEIVNPAHPAVIARTTQFYREMGKRYGKYPAFGGFRSRFSKAWPGSFEP